jgi:hypothetical protein
MSDDAELGTNLFEEPAPVKAKKGKTLKASQKDPEARSWIVLEESSDIPPTGLPISVNGDTVMIMAGEPVHIQNKYIEVLDNAIVSVPQLDAGQRVVGHRDRHRFPYRMVDAPDNAG